MTQDTIVTLRTFNDLMEATLVQNKLKSAGIESFLENENSAGINPLGGVALKVFSKDEMQASKITTE